MAKAIVGKEYRHYKGIPVKVIAIGKHSETREEMVVYEKLADGDEYKKGDVWIRPKEMFEETVTRDGKTFPRFELID